MDDKTRTLTFGEPEVRAVIPAPGTDAQLLLTTTASAELRSEHPFGETIVAYARARGCVLKEPERFGYTPGLGIDAVLDADLVLIGNQALMRAHDIALPAELAPRHAGALEVFVARAGRPLGAILVADTTRPEARQAIDAIHGMGLRTTLLTGDSRAVAEGIVHDLGIRNSRRICCPTISRCVSGNWWRRVGP